MEFTDHYVEDLAFYLQHCDILVSAQKNTFKESLPSNQITCHVQGMTTSSKKEKNCNLKEVSVPRIQFHHPRGKKGKYPGTRHLALKMQFTYKPDY